MIHLIRPEPIGTRKTLAFVDGFDEEGRQTRGGVEEIGVPVFPQGCVEAGRELRAVRVQCGLSLGEAARLLHLNVVDLTDLERGHAMVSEVEHGEILLRWRQNVQPPSPRSTEKE